MPPVSGGDWRDANGKAGVPPSYQPLGRVAIVAQLVVSKTARYAGELTVPIFETPWSVPAGWGTSSNYFLKSSMWPSMVRASRCINPASNNPWWRIANSGSILYSPVNYSIMGNPDNNYATISNDLGDALYPAYYGGMFCGHTYTPSNNGNWGTNDHNNVRGYFWFHLLAGVQERRNPRASISANSFVTPSTTANYATGQLTTHVVSVDKAPFFMITGGTPLAANYRWNVFNPIAPDLNRNSPNGNNAYLGIASGMQWAGTIPDFDEDENYSLGSSPTGTAIRIVRWNIYEIDNTRYNVTLEVGADNSLFNNSTDAGGAQITSRGFLIKSKTTSPAGAVQAILLAKDADRYWRFKFAPQSAASYQAITSTIGTAAISNMHIDPEGIFYYVRGTNPQANQMFSSYGFNIPWNSAGVEAYKLNPITLPCYGTCRAVPMKIGNVI